MRRTRERSFHFPGHYLAPSFTRMEAQGCEVRLDVERHCTNDRGDVDWISLGVSSTCPWWPPIRARHPGRLWLSTPRCNCSSTGDPADLTEEERRLFDGVRGVRPQVGNRNGDVQGGGLLGLAASTALETLSGGWSLSSLSFAYVSPGRPPSVRAVATTIHRGRTTAVVRVQLRNRDGKLVGEGLATLLVRHP